MLSNITKFASKNAGSILSGMAIGFTSVAIIATGKATIEAVRIVDEADISPRDNKFVACKEIVKMTWPHYLPVIFYTSCAIGCIVGANYAHLNKQAGLMAALAFSENKFMEFKNTLPAEKVAKVERDILEKNASQTMPKEKPIEGKMWCYEPETKQWFQATTEQILWAELTANKMFKNEDQLTMNQFLQLLPGTHPVSWGDNFGWYIWDENGSWDWNWSFYRGGAPWIDIQPQIGTVDGQECIIIAYGMHPGESGDIPEALKEVLPRGE